MWFSNETLKCEPSRVLELLITFWKFVHVTTSAGVQSQVVNQTLFYHSLNQLIIALCNNCAKCNIMDLWYGLIPNFKPGFWTQEMQLTLVAYSPAVLPHICVFRDSKVSKCSIPLLPSLLLRYIVVAHRQFLFYLKLDRRFGPW